MNVRQLQYAVMLSQDLNISQTAEKLGLSQPALSKQILSLENELGVKLFDRNHVPMTLTPAGSFFISKAKSMLYEQEQLLKAMERFKSGENGCLDIGVTPFRSVYLMPDVVKAIKARFPGIQIVLHEANSATLRKNAIEGKYDFAVVNLPVDDSLLTVLPLEADVLVLAVPNSMLNVLPAATDEGISFKDCAQLPFVVVGETQEMRQLYERLCAQADIRPVIAAEVVGLTTAWAMARAGVGATLLPYQFVKRDNFDNNLTLIPIRGNVYQRQPAIVFRRGQYISPNAEYAIQLLKKASYGDLSEKDGCPHGSYTI